MQNNNRITYVRNEKGEFVKKSVEVVKFVSDAVVDVARLYADLLKGLLDLSIRVGLFIFFFPQISEFCRLFIEWVSQI